MPSVSLHDLNTFPSAATLVDVRQGTSFSRDDLLGEARRRAQSLREAGVEAGSSVVVGQASAVDYIVDLFALWSLGAMAVAVEPNLTASEQSLVAESVGALLWRGEDRREIGSARPARRSTTSNEGDALVLLTSGTTGRPKGVVHSRDSINSRIEANLQAIGHEDLAEHSAGASDPFRARPDRQHADRARRGRHGPSVARSVRGGDEGVPRSDRQRSDVVHELGASILANRTAGRATARSFVRTRACGSAPLSAVLWEQIADWCGTRRVFNMYGMSEAANWIAGASIEDNGGDGFVGRPWGGAFAVLDGFRGDQPVGVGRGAGAQPVDDEPLFRPSGRRRPPPSSRDG